MLRPLPDRQVQQLHYYAAQHEPNQKSLDLVPRPRPESLCRKLEAALQTESVVVEPNPKRFADYEQQQKVHEKRQHITLKSYPVRKVPQPARPSRRQQDNQKYEPNNEIGDP